jgi:hypothetical protein
LIPLFIRLVVATSNTNIPFAHSTTIPRAPAYALEAYDYALLGTHLYPAERPPKLCDLRLISVANIAKDVHPTQSHDAPPEKRQYGLRHPTLGDHPPRHARRWLRSLLRFRHVPILLRL